jgi:excisionase family DNA binding protein
MRRHISEKILESESDELLTTGEAAALLGSSRQHVVNLCEAGDLPYVRVGTHRRIRRADLEAHRAGSVRLTRDQRRSLWLAHAVAGKLVSDPETHLAIARQNLGRQRGLARGRAVTWLDEWERLLRRPLYELLEALTSMSSKGRELRQNSPFVGVLSDREREHVLQAWGDYEATER